MSMRIAVIGGGVSGLTACYRLRQALGPSARIDLVESSERLGGILHTVALDGITADVGAEAFIVRRPEALDLLAELGLGDQVVSPTPRRPAVWSGNRLHDLPRPALMGIPAGPDAVAGLVSQADLGRIATEPDRPWRWTPGTDMSVGELIGDRFGPSVLARSVDPMLGGVYSCLAADIGVREALPALAAKLDAGAPGLSAAVGELVAAAGGGSGPVFGAVSGGYRMLVDALRAAAAPTVYSPITITSITGTGGHWRLVADGGELPARYDGVIVAVAAWTGARLLAEVAPDATQPLSTVGRAPSAVVSMTFAPGTPLPEYSGVLVATGEDLHAKAFTFSSQKWAQLSGPAGIPVIRASFGRFGEPIPDERTSPGIDARLVAWALRDLDRICAVAGRAPVSDAVRATHVAHWTLPRYAPGHLAAMARVRETIPSGIALAGCAYGGIGVPACIGEAGRAVTALLAGLN
ncbi:MAG: protoporphyrinogen oxidase [Gordonia sp. (in: high G+C Gram-positive bacteria)]